MTGADERLAALAALFDPARGPDALVRLAEPGAGEAALRARHLAGLPRRERLAALAAALSDPAALAAAIATAAASERQRAAAALRRTEAVGPALRRIVRERLAAASTDAGTPAVRGADPAARPLR